MKVYVNPRTIKQIHFDQLVEKFPSIQFVGDLSKASDAEVIICNPSFLTKDQLDYFTHLRWVHLLMSGYNTVDLADLSARNIALTNSKDVFHIQIAEDVFTKILVLNRDVMPLHSQMKQGLWKPIPDDYEIYHSTVGIIGAGSIASEIAKRLQAFDATVLGWRRNPEPQAYFNQILTGTDGLHQLLRKSDVVVVAIPLSKETYHLLNHERLSMMKQSALLINIARGEIIDQDALVTILQNKGIRGAGLDVVYPEPLPSDHLLWKLDNVYLSPHNASSSQQMFPRIIALIEENLRRYLQKEALLHIVVDFPQR
jgi:D-2-hydroxyacid dehydrogenase (NADP+)